MEKPMRPIKRVILAAGSMMVMVTFVIMPVDVANAQVCSALGLPKRCVVASDIATNAVRVRQIAKNAVKSSEIAPRAVGKSELKPRAVTGAKIADGTISSADLAPSVLATNEQKLNTLISALLVCPAGAPTRFVDNGDGTICDHETGLMWEQKDGDDGGSDLNNPHDVDNAYTWSSMAGSDDPDGTAFTDFLARLNGEVASTAPSEQLGGHRDWRLPTSAELQGLLLEPFLCSISPCIIDQVFAPTAAFFHWSSTSSAGGPGGARGVGFNGGSLFDSGKGDTLSVRAVRGGR